MATQVTVIDPAARRQVVKVTPGTYLNDVLQEACTKFRLDSSQYGLKYGDNFWNTFVCTGLNLTDFGSGTTTSLWIFPGPFASQG